MLKRILLLVLILGVALFSAACESTGQTGGQSDVSSGAGTGVTGAEVDEPEVITVVHQLGETPVVKNPQTVVVFDFGTLDTLDKLGVQVKAVPKSHVPGYLEKYGTDAYENAGGLMEPDFEAINAMKPDLIIISGRQLDFYEEFAKIGPTIYLAVDNTQYMKSFKVNAETIGRIFGKEEEVKQELERIEATIEELKKKAAEEGDKKGLVVLTTGGKVSAYGPGSRFGVIHDDFGIKPVDETIEASTHGMSISFEYIAEKDPDYLFVVDRDAVVSGQAGAQEVIENDLVKGTKAYKDGKIIYLDPNYWYLSGGGLISVSEMVKAIEAVFE